jgi:hypothetical protein
MPSLTKCYKYNKSACCVAAHDSAIQSDYSSLLPDQCQREYDGLENYFCYGCNPSEASSTHFESNTIRLCRSFVEGIWGNNLMSPTTTFDNCGMTTFWRPTDEQSTVIPSAEWANAYQFFWEVKPTFFGDFNVIIIDDSLDTNCFSAAGTVLLGLGVLAI